MTCFVSLAVSEAGVEGRFESARIYECRGLEGLEEDCFRTLYIPVVWQSKDSPNIPVCPECGALFEQNPWPSEPACYAATCHLTHVAEIADESFGCGSVLSDAVEDQPWKT